MHEIMALKENLMQELGEYGRMPKMSVEDVMVVKAMSSAVDHLCNILMAAEEEEGMSMRGGQGGGGRYSYERGGSRYSREGGGRYSREGGENRYSSEGGQGGSSYARGRNARRDSNGRYSGGGYSRAAGVDDLVEDIQNMMQELPPNLQQDAQRFMQKLEQEM